MTVSLTESALFDQILTTAQWGYDADVMNFFRDAGKCSIYAHAWQLLEDINLKRKTPDEVRDSGWITSGFSVTYWLTETKANYICRAQSWRSGG